MVEGCKAGVYVLLFDNSYSMLTSKTLRQPPPAMLTSKTLRHPPPAMHTSKTLRHPAPRVTCLSSARAPVCAPARRPAAPATLPPRASTAFACQWSRDHWSKRRFLFQSGQYDVAHWQGRALRWLGSVTAGGFSDG